MVTETSAYRKRHQSQTELPDLHQASQKHHSGPLGGQEHVAYPGYLSMASGSKAKTGQQQQTQEQDSEEKSKAEGLLRSRKAVLPTEVRHRERSTEDPWRGRWEEEQEMPMIRIRQAMELGGLRGRERDGPIYVHKKVEDTSNQPRAAHAEVRISAFSTDSGNLLSSQNQVYDFTEGQVESQVSVAQLRHSYMEGTTTTQASSKNKQ